ncbi:MAG TPA: bifunctional diaminohydroxyphosphoribosylaminopyrimidine deaminase/5-amino-6-(5-phosphoribosylamino)uracil reductase RibD [Solirubrobacterales bacterium]|jgi:diaminohydroxyphosphoribosylaminopyrimidine deaminase/5-amino-6-(5-phosphoribosylamino)uracil reductase|nr:bifunctional diaminohydroxyphosphoribosylaminopyrimidine deaminase/5-amino-6-(5-phosphoribosylamino)uracil reductase RibD [Solirubrobacterales bacterium]
MNSQLTATDQAYLRQALELAELGRGRVSPNPLVGAVVVRDGEVVGEGYHAELGQLHAERAALADCAERGNDPAGATMYVTLEPCAHQGRQPPCVEAILEAGIARVVIASEDPSEKASGRGPGILRDGGVEVASAAGAEAAAARLLNQPFRKHARTGLPLVALKLAMSLDGVTSTAPGDSPWISGETSRALVHRWRAESDAIAAGIGTVLTDDPLLTARPAVPEGGSPFARIADQETPTHTARQPLRVVFDSQARLPLDSQLLATLDQSAVLVIISPDADSTRVSALRDAGAEIQAASGATPADRISSALADLGRRGITSLFLEGGKTLASAFASADQLDESRTFVAPVLLGQPGDVARAGGPGGEAENVNIARRPLPPGQDPPRRPALSHSVEAVGDDTLITARYKEW